VRVSENTQGQHKCSQARQTIDVTGYIVNRLATCVEERREKEKEKESQRGIKLGFTTQCQIILIILRSIEELTFIKKKKIEILTNCVTIFSRSLILF